MGIGRIAVDGLAAVIVDRAFRLLLLVCGVGVWGAFGAGRVVLSRPAAKDPRRGRAHAVAAKVIAMRYFPGKFLNAMKPESARENESMWIGLESEALPHRRLVVRQIAGAYARRVVCPLRPGEGVA